MSFNDPCPRPRAVGVFYTLIAANLLIYMTYSVSEKADICRTGDPSPAAVLRDFPSIDAFKL